MFAKLPCVYFGLMHESWAANFKTITLGPTDQSSQSQVNILRIGTPLSIDRATRTVCPAAPELKNTYEMFTNWLNYVRRGIVVNGVHHLLSILLVDDEGTPDGVTAATKYLTEDMGVSIILGPCTSTLTKPMAAVANSTGALVVAPNSASPAVFRGRPNVFGTLTPAPLWYIPAVEALAAKGIKTLAYFYEDSGFQTALCNIKGKAEELGLEVVLAEKGPKKWETGFEDVIGRLKELQPDAVISCVYGIGDVNFVAELRRLNYAPKMVMLAKLLPEYLTQLQGLGLPEDTGRFVAGLELWNGNAPLSSPWTKTQQHEAWTASDFYKYYEGNYSKTPGWFGPCAWASMEALVQAIESANSFNPDDIAAQLRVMDINTLWGQVKFNANNQNTGFKCKVIQYSASSTEAIFVAPMNLEGFIYPMPSWDERTCVSTTPVASVYGYDGNGQCITCPEVSAFHDDLQRRICEPCPADMAAVEVHTSGSVPERVCLTQCPAGQELGDGACQKCIEGEFEAGGKCVKCAKGSASKEEGISGSCTFCPVGRVAVEEGMIECVACGLGRFSDGLGSSSCAGCGRLPKANLWIQRLGCPRALASPTSRSRGWPRGWRWPAPAAMHINATIINHQSSILITQYAQP